MEIERRHEGNMLRVNNEGEVFIDHEVRQQLDRIEEMLRLLISDRKLTQHLKEDGYK